MPQAVDPTSLPSKYTTISGILHKGSVSTPKTGIFQLGPEEAMSLRAFSRLQVRDGETWREISVGNKAIEIHGPLIYARGGHYNPDQLAKELSKTSDGLSVTPQGFGWALAVAALCLLAGIPHLVVPGIFAGLFLPSLFAPRYNDSNPGPYLERFVRSHQIAFTPPSAET